MGAYFGARRGAAVGAMQTFFGLGAFLGPVFGTRLESWTNSWSPSFYAYVIAGIASVAVVAAVVIPLEFTDAGRGPSLVGDAERPTASIWTRDLILSACFIWPCRILALFVLGAVRELRPHRARILGGRRRRGAWHVRHWSDARCLGRLARR